MRASVGLSITSRLATAVAALWFWGAGPAWAGGEGGSVGNLQAFLGDPAGKTGFCDLLGMTTCPQVPTLAQLALQISALVNSPPDLVRSPAGPGPNSTGGLGVCTPAGNLGKPVCSQTNAINAVNPVAPSSITLSSLEALAFAPPTTTSPGLPVPVILGTSGANSFFYAVTTEGSGQPDTLSLSYDYPALTNTNFGNSQQVATLSLPLVALNLKGSAAGAEQVVPTKVQITACGPNCLNQATATANFFGTQPVLASSLGLQAELVFDTSPNSSAQHAIFKLKIPLIVTGPAHVQSCQHAINSSQPDVQDCGNDPAYFGVVPFAGTDGATGSPTFVNQVSGLPTAFASDALGFQVNGVGIGIAPYAAPLGNATTFGFCASFLANDGAVHPTVATFLSIGTDGTTYVSSPKSPAGNPPLTCPS
jgi:hypothetical protein